MKFLRGAVLLIAAVTLSACASPDRFDNDNTTSLGGAGISDGSASDPTSPLYFQQAVGDRVLFSVDQSTLDSTAQAVLDGQAVWLAANSDYNAIIEGHADEQGTREYNLALGARRADAAREYLLSKGVAAARLKVVSYGKERPIEICSQESCYALNRRSVTILSTGLSS
ncbi:MAG: peptidoglycan-associated lipoprotein Pal [Rhodobacterales bacterium]|nr:peptidoglycan-associated lipoprotein Pal [Rhodobacterales bacterium]